jgi:ketosteroid isomerase-like protein
MQFVLALSLSTLLATAAATPPDPVAEVRQAENDFAASFAARDKAKFGSFLQDDAMFWVQGKPVVGRENVVKAWSGLLDPEKPPFSWKSEVAVVSADGMTAFSTGGVFTPDGTRVSRFTSTWRKQKDGSWKVQFDGPGSPICPPAK